MRVLVDTCVWSLALRRDKRPSGEKAEVEELRRLIAAHVVELIGPVRQEILSGVRDDAQFDRLEAVLGTFPDVALEEEDFVMAARFFNLCRANGIQGANTDFLLCAVAVRRKWTVFTTDKDFRLYARHIPVELHHG